MEYIIIVFWSRTEAFSYANNLKKFGIASAIIPTPKEAGKTCGLSVKIMPEDYIQARSILSRGRYSSFGGFLRYVFKNGRYSFVKE